MPGSDLCTENGYATRGFSSFSSPFRKMTEYYLKQATSGGGFSFKIHYSLNILSLDAI
jgi:hypothetical protein